MTEQVAYEQALQAKFGHKTGRRWGLGAFIRGWNDAKNYQNKNPYFDHRTIGGQVTFARGYRRMWQHGYDAHLKYRRGCTKQSLEREIAFLNTMLGDSFESTSSALTRASVYSWRPDFDKPRDVRVAEAQEIIRGKIVEHQQRIQQIESLDC